MTYIRFETYLWAELLSDLVINGMDDGGQLTWTLCGILVYPVQDCVTLTSPKPDETACNDRNI